MDSSIKSITIVSVNINTISNANKIEALRSFLRRVAGDIVFVQEVYDDKMQLPGYNIETNVDHTKRGTAIALKDNIQYSHVERSLDSRLICVRLDNNTSLCNIYAPSGSQARAGRESLFNGTMAYYLRNAPGPVILAGDFNCVLKAKDSTSGGNICLPLQSAVDNLGLCDSWEHLRGNEVEFSHITRGSGSRIDRCYISKPVKGQLRDTNLHVLSFSDHKALTVRLALPEMPDTPRNGYWQLRPHVLTAENIETFRVKWSYWTRQKKYHKSWMDWWINFAKPRIKSFFRWKTNQKYGLFHSLHNILYTQLKNTYEHYLVEDNELTNINRIKSEMLRLQRRFSEEFRRINETRVGGEKVSMFQIGEQRQRRNVIQKLKCDNGEEILEPKAVINHIQAFYRKLYSAEAICRIVIPQVARAGKKSSPRKSPGPDGLPIEFYLKTLHVIWRELVLILNERNVPRKLCGRSSSSGGGKRGGMHHVILPPNLPPSPLNTDYKLLSRVLKHRIQGIVDKWHVISPSQKCCNKPGNIFQAVLSVKEKIIDLRRKKRCGKLVSFDLSQAFDRVNREFLAETMKALGFNAELTQLIKTIGQRSNSRVLVNGVLSQPFAIQRSVRQGDPLSMHLFVIYLHPPIKKLEGICSDQDDLVNAYADDISVVSTSSVTIQQVRSAFEASEHAQELHSTGHRSQLGHCHSELPPYDVTTSYSRPEPTAEGGAAEHVPATEAMVCCVGMQRLSKRHSKGHQHHWSGTLEWVWRNSRATAATCATTPQRRSESACASDQYSGFVNESVRERAEVPSNRTSTHSYRRHTHTACLAYVPQALRIAPTTRSLRKVMVNVLSKARIQMTTRGVSNWRKVWKNIHNSDLTSEQRSALYMLANGKVSHGELLVKIGRVSSAACVWCNCPESIEHKFALCPRVKDAWELVQEKMRTLAGYTFSFHCLRFPELVNVSAAKRTAVLRLCANYVLFIMSKDDSVIDVDLLICSL
uniref:Uncharacterized protein n=1 Tax=Anopheles albimanus TaxID=7167 RepID=A0A182FLS7_ANOAL